jgi:hypothetical protein
MKKSILMAVILLCSVNAANAYVVDGNVSDWGVDLTPTAAKNVGYLNTHTPTGSGVSYITEDNASSANGLIYVNPGYSQGNIYDAEAMYLANNHSNLYLAIVTGLPQFGAQYPAGDIFFDTGKYQDPTSPFYNPKKYSFGLDISNSKLYDVSSWQDVVIFSQSNPWAIGSGLYLGDVAFTYSAAQNTHYVLEAGVPLNLLGLNNGGDLWAHWTMECGNDTLNLRKSVVVTPEPSSMILFGLGIFMAFVIYAKREGIFVS